MLSQVDDKSHGTPSTIALKRSILVHSSSPSLGARVFGSLRAITILNRHTTAVTIRHRCFSPPLEAGEGGTCRSALPDAASPPPERDQSLAHSI
ncbi:MAG: hypothetical protein ACUVSL_06815 [Chloroflexus sp.]|uniref:hypothetical protein n=1 Tax=Chloroflexus sp. TaxID=1904827 RepID=UPI00404A60BA